MEDNVIKINKPDDMDQVFKDGQEIEVEGVRLRYDKHEECSHCALRNFELGYCINARCHLGYDGVFTYIK